MTIFEKCPRPWRAEKGERWHYAPRIIASNNTEICRVAVDGQRNDSEITWNCAVKIAESVSHADDTQRIEYGNQTE